MKIAVASDGVHVSAHFGHCDGWKTWQVQDGKLTDPGFISNPGHQRGFLPKFLAEHGVNVIIAGGMGANAQMLFQEHGVEIVTGATGPAEEAALQYAAGKLQSQESVCHEHAHANECHKE